MILRTLLKKEIFFYLFQKLLTSNGQFIIFEADFGANPSPHASRIARIREKPKTWHLTGPGGFWSKGKSRWKSRAYVSMQKIWGGEGEPKDFLVIGRTDPSGRSQERRSMRTDQKGPQRVLLTFGRSRWKLLPLDCGHFRPIYSSCSTNLTV